MSIEEAKRALFDAKNPILYLGAGISRSAPSNIPLFKELMSLYLEAIDPPKIGILHKHAGKEWEEVNNLICQLPTEAFFADIRFLLGKTVFQPLNWFNARPTNQSHKHIGCLVQNLGIHTVLTPNFDRLLEKILPGFKEVVDMKPFFRNESIEEHLINAASLPEYLDPTVDALFHLHGTIGTSVIDISPAAIATPYNHFDHANLEPRLRGSTILFAGCSGAYDRDVIDLFRKSDLQSGVWISHCSKSEFEVCEFPSGWRDLFSGRCYAIRGNTPKILAVLAGNEYTDELVDNLFEFRNYLVDFFMNLTMKQRLLCLVNFTCQINRGDIALSILDEFEHEEFKEDTYKSEDNDFENRLILSTCDSVELNDGRIVDAERFLTEYEKEAAVYFRFNDVKWDLAVGRARAIAVSRNPLELHPHQQAIEILKTEVLAVLDKVVPYEQISPLTQQLCPVAVREWMLAYESLGIFYLEAGDGLHAIRYFDKATSICCTRDDLLRLYRAKHLAGTRIQSDSILNAEERQLIKELLNEYQ